MQLTTMKKMKRMPPSGSRWVKWNITKLVMQRMMLPITMKGRFLPNLPLVLSTMKPTKGSVTPSHIRIIMEKLEATTMPTPTKPIR